jgi:hypothetical protein
MYKDNKTRNVKACIPIQLLFSTRHYRQLTGSEGGETMDALYFLHSPPSAIRLLFARVVTRFSIIFVLYASLRPTHYRAGLNNKYINNVEMISRCTHNGIIHQRHVLAGQLSRRLVVLVPFDSAPMEEVVMALNVCIMQFSYAQPGM